MKTERDRLSRRALFADLGYAPHPWQWEVHRSRASRRVVACGVRAGKTRCAALEGVAAALDPAERSIGWVVAPTYDLADRVFREIQVIALERLRHRVIEMRESDRRLILRNMGGGISEIRAKSADNPVSLLGEGLDWLIVDEFARLKPTIWEAHLTQRLLDKRGWAMLISTPKGRGLFYELYRRGQNGADPDFQSWNLPSWSNPLLDSAIIEAERARLPDRVFAQEYGGRFIEGAGSVFSNVRECATGTFEEPQRGLVYGGGLDLARVEDFTVLTIVSNKSRVVYVDRFRRLDWTQQLLRIRVAAERYRLMRLAVDSTGVGDPIVEALRIQGLPAEPYVFTRSSKGALINNLILLLERKELVLPSPRLWPEGIDELESFQYSVSESGNTRTGAPSGQHDDLVISLALACWYLRKKRIWTYEELGEVPNYVRPISMYPQ